MKIGDGPTINLSQHDKKKPKTCFEKINHFDFGRKNDTDSIVWYGRSSRSKLVHQTSPGLGSESRNPSIQSEIDVNTPARAFGRI